MKNDTFNSSKEKIFNTLKSLYYYDYIRAIEIQAKIEKVASKGDLNKMSTLKFWHLMMLKTRHDKVVAKLIKSKDLIDKTAV